jgi:hypothetical protein
MFPVDLPGAFYLGAKNISFGCKYILYMGAYNL